MCKDRKLLRKLQLDVIYRELRHQCISVTKAMQKIFSFFLRSQSLSRCTHFEKKNVKNSCCFLFYLDFHFIPFSQAAQKSKSIEKEFQSVFVWYFGVQTYFRLVGATNLHTFKLWQFLGQPNFLYMYIVFMYIVY